MVRRRAHVLGLVFLASLWLGTFALPADAQITTIETVPPDVDDEGRASVRSWLFRIATNVCIDMGRSPQRRAVLRIRPERAMFARIDSAGTMAAPRRSAGTVNRPTLTEDIGSFRFCSTPSIRTSPDVDGAMPPMARRSSPWPDPCTPAIPTILPAGAENVIP